ncbi:ABC transporter permease subunit [Clostridiaceae bacterium WCA-383-APC-5B]|uniref:ABC transporter permease subunit n=2 Tax=Inconstantimicrobium porci TaxID=2652291 RepID=A0A7X2T370_9CLOT|nr:ABC transporter permease subunit [Inconstantimicrobium porci]
MQKTHKVKASTIVAYILLILLAILCFAPFYIMIINCTESNADLASKLNVKQYISSTVPDALIEAARIDGCGEFKIFNKIILPIMIVFLFCSKYIIGGLTVGSVKE